MMFCWSQTFNCHYGAECQTLAKCFSAGLWAT